MSANRASEGGNIDRPHNASPPVSGSGTPPVRDSIKPKPSELRIVPISLTDFPTLNIDTAQTILDAAGLVPGYGEAADLLNAGIYAARGDGANAVLSLASMIPFVGAFGTVGKVVNKGAKAADKASDVANAANKAGKAAEGAGKVALKDGAKMTTKQALDAAEQYLGKGYKDMGGGRFVSADGTRQVRFTNGDLSTVNNHAGAPHMNFETMVPNPRKPGKMMPDPTQNIHIFLLD